MSCSWDSRVVILTWTARAGEHDYRIEVWEGEKLEASKSGSLSVSKVVNGLAARLEVEPSVVKAGNDVTVFITIQNLKEHKQTWPIQIVDSAGNVQWPHESYQGLNYSISSGQLTIYARKTARIMATIGPITQNTSLTLEIGGMPMASAYVEVRPVTVHEAFMDCSNLKLSADKGDLTLDMKCKVYFTNPTKVQWNITRVDTDAHVLKTPRTRDLTIEPTKTIITHTVPPGRIGELELEFHDVLPQSGFIETGLELKDLGGAKVPVQVNFTVYANGHPYVKTSQGILDLAYTATQYVEIKVEWNSVIQHIVADTVAGVVIGAGAVVGSIIPGAGTMTGAAVGGIIGGTLGFIYGVVWHGILGRP